MAEARTRWGATVAAVTSVCTAVAWLVVGPGPLVAVVLGAGVVGVISGASLAIDGPDTCRVARSSGVLSVAGALVVLGLAPLVGPWALSVPLTAAACHPTVVAYLRGASSRRQTGPVEELSTETLLRRWLGTERALRRAGDAGDLVVLARLVRERQELLDEIVRRDPALLAGLSGSRE